MARRVLTVHEFIFREKNKSPKEARIIPPGELNGQDLGTLFFNWAEALTEEETHDPKSNFWVARPRVKQHGPHVVILELAAGSTGEVGQVVNSTTGKIDLELTEKHAATGQNRALLFSPPEGNSAFFFAESSRRASAGTRIRKLFERYLRETQNSIKVEVTTVSEGELWAEKANLKQVELRVEGKAADIADGIDVEVGSISHMARPKRRKFFSPDILKQLRNDKFIANKLVSIPAETEGDVYVTLDDGERQKTFQVDGGGAPSFRLVITSDGEPSLSDNDLVQKCVDQLSSLSSRTGRVSWRQEWSTPNGEEHGQDLPTRNS